MSLLGGVVHLMECITYSKPVIRPQEQENQRSEV